MAQLQDSGTPRVSPPRQFPMRAWELWRQTAITALAACRAVVEANDNGMTAEEGRRAVELCRAAIAERK